MKITIFGINYTPEMIGIAKYTSGLAEGLAKRGHEVSVVTALPYYPGWKIKEGWQRPFWIRQLHAGGVKAIHCPIYVPRTPSGNRRILHYLSFLASSFPLALWHGLVRRPDVVLAIAPSLIASLSALSAARLCGAKAWLHIQDFEVEAAFATKLLKQNGRRASLATRFESWVLRQFDRVSSISSPMLAKAREKGVSAERTYELRNWADLSCISPIKDASPIRKSFGINTQYVALYSGNLANKQGLEIIPEMAKQLTHRNDLTFVVCGEGPVRETLLKQSDGLENICFFPLQPHEKLNSLLGMADVHLLPQIAGAADLVLPSKLCNMLASGRPVLATTGVETGLGQEVEGAGVLTPAGDAAAAAQALNELLDDSDRRQNLGAAANKRAHTRWDMEAILNNFQNALIEAVGNGENKQRTAH